MDLQLPRLETISSNRKSAALTRPSVDIIGGCSTLRLLILFLIALNYSKLKYKIAAQKENVKWESDSRTKKYYYLCSSTTIQYVSLYRQPDKEKLFILTAFRDGGRHLKATDKVLTNQPPSIVVMQFDQRLYVALLSVSAVHEFPWLLQTKTHVVTTTAPLPPVRRDGGRGESDRGLSATGFRYFRCAL